MPEALIRTLKKRLEASANPATKVWWERYMKGVLPFRGVRMADTRRAVHAWHATDGPETLSSPEQFNLSIQLLRERHAEDKLAGILYTAEILLAEGHLDPPGCVSRWAALFDEGAIADWNTCDWFCVKVLGPAVVASGPSMGIEVANWATAPNLWRARASVVAFVNLAAKSADEYEWLTKPLLAACAVTVGRPERFAQTGTGWVLRELGVAQPIELDRFLQRHLASFSREGLKYALEKSDPSKREHWLALHSVRRDHP